VCLRTSHESDMACMQILEDGLPSVTDLVGVVNGLEWHVNEFNFLMD
jgi:hypothetical protein